VSILGPGGQILLQTPDVHDEAVELINSAIDMGISYCDTAAGYRPSEIYYGEVMALRRREVFLATKAHDRTREGAWRSIEESLSNLQTDYVDLVQVHHLDHLDELDIILQPGGALAALTEARDQGLTRFIGVSSHDIDTLLAALDAFDFDTVLIRVNPLDPIRGDFIGRALPLARQHNMGIIAMKVMDRRRLVTAGFDPALLLRYTLTQQVSTAIVGCAGLDDLQANVHAARRFIPMDRRQRRLLEHRCCAQARPEIRLSAPSLRSRPAG
jgi:aryl-alcohol dehydrogenase-like predicted oxidoreductase